MEDFISAEDCNNEITMRGGNIYDSCFYYQYATSFIAQVEVENEKYSIPIFRGVHHGFIVAEGDTLDINWNFLVPVN